MHIPKTCVVLPTLNERGTIGEICESIPIMLPNSEILVVDDNSDDGTIEVLEKLIADGARITLVVHPDRQGIGSAHKFGLRWALDNEFEIAVTMDADLTHNPGYIPMMVSNLTSSDMTIGSRFVSGGGLENWTLLRTLMTYLGHILTKSILRVPFDASSGFRAYRLSPNLVQVVELAPSNSYSFLIESLVFLMKSRFSVNEVPVVLPNRTYGNSKMRVSDAVETVRRVFMARRIARRTFELTEQTEQIPTPTAEDWNRYWSYVRRSERAYARVATIFRKTVIRRSLKRSFNKHIPPGSHCLHAGSGSGEVDQCLVDNWFIYGLDFSAHAVNQYRTAHARSTPVVLGDNFYLPFRNSQFDCVFNLGVMEHFTDAEIVSMLNEFKRVLKKDGKVILFWPPVYGSTVIFLRIIHTFARLIRPDFKPLHPKETSLIRNRSSIRKLFKSVGFSEITFRFEALDLFTHEVISARASN